MKTAPPQIAFDNFLKVDIRVGRIVAAEPFPEARKPAYRLTIDFGPAIGVKKSSAQITRNHRLEDLPGRLVLAVVNFPPRQIGPTMSEVLLGVPDADGEVMLIGPWAEVPVGGRLYWGGKHDAISDARRGGAPRGHRCAERHQLRSVHRTTDCNAPRRGLTPPLNTRIYS